MTRQRFRQMYNNEHGYCRFHNHVPIYRANMCKECYDKDTARRHARNGVKSPYLEREKLWEKVNWNWPRQKIADHMGVSLATVAYRRRRFFELKKRKRRKIVVKPYKAF